MKILILGDVMGLSGRNAIKKNISQIIKENKINFSIINGENAADDAEVSEAGFSKQQNTLTGPTTPKVKSVPVPVTWTWFNANSGNSVRFGGACEVLLTIMISSVKLL